MKYSRLILILLIGTIYSCSSSNKEYIDIIKQQLKDDSQGLELNYKNLEFKWVDTLKVHEKLLDYEQDFKNGINEILAIDYYVKDNFKEGKLFSKVYLTYDRLNELRNWERNRRNESSMESAKVINDESIYKFQDYYEYAFENRTASSWLIRLCAQIERTDSLLKNYNELEEGNIDLMKTALWYYNRIDDFHSNHNPDPYNTLGKLDQEFN